MLRALLSLICGGPPKPTVKRSSRWPALARSWLAEHPECAVCGTKDGVVPHHKIPVHVDPTHELSRDNLVSLCPVHHLWDGHLGYWKSWNVDVDKDVVRRHEQIANRPLLKAAA